MAIAQRKAKYKKAGDIMKIVFKQTDPIYFTENLNCEEKREFPVKIFLDDQEVFTGAVFDGENYNLVYSNCEYSLEKINEQFLDIEDFWELEGCDQIYKTYLEFVNSVFQHGYEVLHGKATWNNFVEMSEGI
jgi:hypothetical protein